MKQIFLLLLSMFFSVAALAQASNPLIGKWKWSSEDCTRGEFVFSEKTLTHYTDADGEAIENIFKNIKYSFAPGSVSVNFGKNHGFGGFKSSSKIKFKIIDKDHVAMDRKRGSLNDLYRCN